MPRIKTLPLALLCACNGMGDPIEGLELLSDHVVQVHVKDALPAEVPGTWGSEVPAGDSAVDWDRFLGVVAGLSEPVDLIIEREAGEARVADILAARRLLMNRIDGPEGPDRKQC